MTDPVIPSNAQMKLPGIPVALEADDPARSAPFEAIYGQESPPAWSQDAIEHLWAVDPQATLDLVLRLGEPEEWEGLLGRAEVEALDPLGVLEQALVCVQGDRNLGIVLAGWERRYPQADLKGLLLSGALERLTYWAAIRPTLCQGVRRLWDRVAGHLPEVDPSVRQALAWAWLRLPPEVGGDVRIWGALLAAGLDNTYERPGGWGWFDLLLNPADHREDQPSCPFPLPCAGGEKHWWKDRTVSPRLVAPTPTRSVSMSSFGEPVTSSSAPSAEALARYQEQVNDRRQAIEARFTLAWQAGLRPMKNSQGQHPLTYVLEGLERSDGWSVPEFFQMWRHWRAEGWRLGPEDRTHLEPVLFRLSRQPTPRSEIPLWWRLVAELWPQEQWWAPEDAAELWDTLAQWPGYGGNSYGLSNTSYPNLVDHQRSVMARLFPEADPGAPACWPVEYPVVTEQRAWWARQSWSTQAGQLIEAVTSEPSRVPHAQLLARLRQGGEISPELKQQVLGILRQAPVGWRYIWIKPLPQLTWPLFTVTAKDKFLETMASRNQENEAAQAWVKSIEQGKYEATRSLVEAKHALPHLDRLQQDFPHFQEVTDRLRQHLALAQRGDRAFSIPPLLLLGAPGIGKTFYFRELARAIAADYQVLHMEAINAGWALTGSEAAWSSGGPGLVFEKIMTARTANPIILFDEVDKCVDSNYPVEPALLSLIEPHTAAEFTDACIPLPLDLRRVSWVATANDLRYVSAPLQSRFDIVTVPQPDRAARRSMAQAIYRALRTEHAWGASFEAEVFEPTLAALTDPSGSARDLRKQMTQGFAAAALANRDRVLPEDLPFRPKRPAPTLWDLPRRPAQEPTPA